MAEKTLTLVDPNDPASAISPPRPLGKHGSLLWQGVLKEYELPTWAGVRCWRKRAPCSTAPRNCASRSTKTGPWSN